MSLNARTLCAALVAGSACALLAACAEPPAPPATVERTDSAGVAIVRNLAATETRWVAGEPELAIGVVEGASEYELAGVYFGGWFDDGRIVISDGASRELRVFSASGDFQRRIGGPGEGPGEFGFPGRMQLRGDTVRVWDPRLRRLTDFDAETGELIEVHSIGREVLNADLVTVLESGDAILQSDLYTIPDVGFELIYADYLRVALDGTVVDTLPRQPLTLMGRLVDVDMVGGPLFGFRAITAGSADGYAVAPASHPEIRRFSGDGALTSIIRWPDGDRAVTPADVDTHVAEALEGVPEEARPRRRQVIEAQSVAEEFPVVDDLHVAREGRLWVRRFVRPGHEGPQAWDVFDADGGHLAVAELPAGIRILEIRDRRILGVVRNELDVEQVRVIPVGPS